MKVEIYSDVGCPWCYIGERRFKRALAGFAGAENVDVVFRPFQLDPGLPRAAQPMNDYLSRRFGQAPDAMLAQVTSVAASESITMDWKRALAANTHAAHRLSQLAAREYGHEKQQELMELLFSAHFSRGMDVSDLEVLTGLAVAAGMDEDRVKDYLASEEGTEELNDALEYARNIGITSVPTFVFNGNFAVQGAQPASTFLQALEEVQRRSASLPDDAADATDAAEEVAGNCVDGNCAV